MGVYIIYITLTENINEAEYMTVCACLYKFNNNGYVQDEFL